MSKNNYISIKALWVNNLKHRCGYSITNLLSSPVIRFRKNHLSLFDTLYAEGQAPLYVKTPRSSYYTCTPSSPDEWANRNAIFIKGIPPAVAMKQKMCMQSPFPFIGTSTEIYEYLRLLYSRVGTYNLCGQEVKKHSTEDIINMYAITRKGQRYHAWPLSTCVKTAACNSNWK